MRQAVDDLRPPALLGLPRQDVASDLPVQQHKFPVDGQCGALLRGVYSALQLDEPGAVALGR